MSNADLDRPISPTPLQGGLRITDDTPGTLLRLSWIGPAPLRWVRLGAPCLLLAFLLWTSGEKGVWQVAWKQVNAPGPRDLGEDLLLGGMACVGAYLLWLCGHLLGQSLGFWDQVSWDANEQMFSAHCRGYLIWGRRTINIAFAQLNFVKLTVGSEGPAALRYELSLSYRFREQRYRDWAGKFTVKGHDRRRDARELLLAIGRILSARGYLVPEESVRRMSWQLALPLIVDDTETFAGRDEEFDEDIAPDDEQDLDEQDIDQDSGDEGLLLPIADQPDLSTRWESERGRELPPIDEQLAAGVSVVEINDKSLFTKIEGWLPGQHVRFVTAQAPAGVFVAAAVCGALVGAGVGGWPVYGILAGFIGPKAIWWPGAVVISGLMGASWLGFIAWNQWQEKVVEFDWRNRQLLFRLGREIQERRLIDIQGVVLSIKTRTEGIPAGKTSPPPKVEFACRLDLILADRDIPLIATDTWESDQTAARRILQPLGDSLAQTLGLKCDGQCDRSPDLTTIRRVLALTPGQKMFLGMLVVGALLGIGNGWQQQRAQQATVQALRQVGAEVVWMDGFGIRQKSVYRDYWNVEMKQDSLVNEHLQQIRSQMLQLPEWGLRIVESPLTDHGLQALDQQLGLRVLDLSQTRITDAGLPALGTCSELVYLNLFRTEVSDAGLKQLAKLQKLRFLYLGGTRVTDAGVALLRQCKSLEYLHLTNSAVTPAGVAKLRNQLPWVEVDFEVFR